MEESNIIFIILAVFSIALLGVVYARESYRRKEGSEADCLAGRLHDADVFRGKNKGKSIGVSKSEREFFCVALAGAGVYILENENDPKLKAIGALMMLSGVVLLSHE